MAGDEGQERRLRYEEIDPRFQRRWSEARQLPEEQVERAFRHGFEARDRFAQRPFEEVAGWLRESWSGLAPATPWDDVADIVRSGYERYQGAGGGVTDPATEALERFSRHTAGGSGMGGRDLGERPNLGDAAPRPGDGDVSGER